MNKKCNTLIDNTETNQNIRKESKDQVQAAFIILKHDFNLTIPKAKPIIRAEVVDWGLKITKSWFSKEVKSWEPTLSQMKNYWLGKLRRNIYRSFWSLQMPRPLPLPLTRIIFNIFLKEDLWSHHKLILQSNDKVYKPESPRPQILHYQQHKNNHLHHPAKYNYCHNSAITNINKAKIKRIS